MSTQTRKLKPQDLSDKALLGAFRKLSALDRKELSGLDMSLEDQEHHSTLWLEGVRDYAKRHWQHLRNLKQKAITQKEYAWCRFLEQLRAPGFATGSVLGRSRDEIRIEATKALYAQFLEAPELPSSVEAARLLDWMRSWRTSHWPLPDRAMARFLSEFLGAVAAGEFRSNIRLVDGSYFRWPSTYAEASAEVRRSIDEPMQPVGVLKASGYVVGNSGLSPSERRQILAAIYKEALTVRLDRGYLAEWGRPQSAIRLRKLANTIAALTRNMKRKRSDAASVEHWQADLDYLKRTFYDGVYDFRWPSLR